MVSNQEKVMIIRKKKVCKPRKIKVFRSEAIRAGFAKLWKDKDYAAIVALADRLPEETIQEDQNLLMYYDISLSRV